MNKRMIVLGVLVVFAFGFLMFSFHASGKKPASTVKITVKGQEVSGGTETDTGNTDSGKINESDFWKETAVLLEKSKQAGTPLYYRITKRDPMQPAFTYAEAASLEPFKLMIKGTSSSLTGVLLGKGKAAAIINERIYRLGDTVGGKKIVAIEKNRVILKKGMDEEILRLENNQEPEKITAPPEMPLETEMAPKHIIKRVNPAG